VFFFSVQNGIETLALERKFNVKLIRLVSALKWIFVRDFEMVDSYTCDAAYEKRDHLQKTFKI